MVKNLPAKGGDSGEGGSMPGLGRYPRRGHGNTLQHSCLGNPTNRRAWHATVHGVPKGVEHDLAATHSIQKH